MSGPVGALKDIYAASRWRAARVVRREVQALRKSGVNVVVFRPGRSEQEVMGNDFMARGRVEEILQESFLAAGANTAKPEVREVLSVLSADCRPRHTDRERDQGDDSPANRSNC